MNSPHCPMVPTFFLVLLFHPLLSPTTADVDADAAALMAFRDAVGRLALPWNTSLSPCKLAGVICTGDRVTSLHLPASGLIGQIPAGTLGNLSNLQTLSLRFNALSSPLPSDLSRCTQLRNLYLHGNRFNGDIPEFLPSLSNLVHLNLADNSFSGEIPQALNNLTRLGTLYLERNQLIGEIPELDLPNLVQFNVSFNRLNGSVPSKLRGMPADAFLDMPLCGGPLSVCPDGEGSSSSSGSELSGGAIAGISIGSVAICLIFVGVLFLLCRRKGKAGNAKPLEVEFAVGHKKIEDEVRSNGKPAKAAAAVVPAALESQKQLVFFGDGPSAYDLGDLLRASAEVLGKGTFGTSYKVVLEMGLVVAVKRLKDANMSQEEFKRKIEVIGAMDHPNLLSLRAYYFSKDEKLLVYDYMPMGNLSSILNGNRGSGRIPLNWEIRSSIALAVARGIEYIHSTILTASHGNIKSSNIFLAGSSEVRVADHGLAPLVSDSTASNRVAGYRAPEVTDTRKVSQKADVYSFGVVLLELLTGKAPAQAILNEGGVDLPLWVQSVIHEEWMTEVFDMELLRYQSVEEEMVQMLQLGVDCAVQFPDRRPTMSAVVERIEEIRRSSLGNSKEQQQGFDVDD